MPCDEIISEKVRPTIEYGVARAVSRMPTLKELWTDRPFIAKTREYTCVCVSRNYLCASYSMELGS